jgi:hypothetical protein
MLSMVAQRGPGGPKRVRSHYFTGGGSHEAQFNDAHGRVPRCWVEAAAQTGTRNRKTQQKLERGHIRTGQHPGWPETAPGLATDEKVQRVTASLKGHAESPDTVDGLGLDVDTYNVNGVNPARSTWIKTDIPLNTGDRIQIYAMGTDITYDGGSNHVNGYGINLINQHHELANANFPCESGNKWAVFFGTRSYYFINDVDPALGVPGGFRDYDPQWNQYWTIKEDGKLEVIFSDDIYNDNSGLIGATIKIDRSKKAGKA